MLNHANELEEDLIGASTVTTMTHVGAKVEAAFVKDEVKVIGTAEKPKNFKRSLKNLGLPPASPIPPVP